jgi:hypothetical protein
MEILAGVLISWALQLLKKVSSKIGKEMTKGITLVVLFAVVFVVTFLEKTGRVPLEFLTQLYTVFLVAVANYEIVIKKVVLPLMDEL